MMKNTKSSSICLFVLGASTSLKVFVLVGTIAISHIISIIIAPFLFLNNFPQMKREGHMVYLYMSLMLCAGLVASSLANQVPITAVWKELILHLTLLSYYIVFYSFLRNNISGLKWFFIGCFVSGIISIWMFNVSVVETDALGNKYFGERSLEDLMQGQLFWVRLIRGLGQLPIFCSYLGVPLIYSVLFPIVFTAITLFITISGRGQSMTMLVGGLLICLGKKSRYSIRRIGRHMIVLFAGALAVLTVYKIVYSSLAKSGILGDDARSKYEGQAAYGTSALSMLMRGRSEFFIATYAALHKPILGFGVTAKDDGRYLESYISKYGVDADMQRLLFLESKASQMGSGVVSIPIHSHIAGEWVRCGLPGLAFFVWYLYIMVRHLRRYAFAVPQWYGYCAIVIPSTAWSIFFNPITQHSGLSLLAVLMVFSRNIAEGKMSLPYDMEIEACRYD